MSNLYDAIPTNSRASKGYNTSRLARVKARNNQEWSRWRRGCVTGVPSFKGKYVSVRAEWRHNAPQEATRATVFSSRPHTMRDAVIPLLVPLKAATGPLQTRLGQSPQQLEAPNETTKLHHNGIWPRGDLNRLGCSSTKSNKIHTRKYGGSKYPLVEV